jgi:peptidoglycan-associated lipoprotein
MKRIPYVMLVATIALGACSKKQPPAQPEATATPPASMPTSNNGDAERAAREAEEARRRAEMERRMALLSERIFFGYDRSDISSEAASTLQAKLPILREDVAIRLRIEGHADERGSIEYNLALGLRRAQAVKDYLAGFGIDASRLTIESFGEDRPLDPSSNERAWTQNRRAEFVSGGGR